MAFFDSSGRITVTNLVMEDGTPIIPGTMLTIDGELVFQFIDHTIPIYTFTSALHSKAITGTKISYNITLTCTNNADPGKPLTVTVPIPDGFTLDQATSEHGTYTAGTTKWVCLLENQTATLNLILTPISTGSQSQTVSLDGDTATLTSTCVISASDADGSIASKQIDLTSYPKTLANMQDGQPYTVVTYSRIDETGVTGVYDGVKNNRIAVTIGSTTYYGERVTLQETIQKITCTFIHDTDHPPIITLYDEYQTVSTDTENRTYGLCLNEGTNNIYTVSKSLLDTPTSMLDDTGATDITLDGASESNGYTFQIAVSNLTNPLSFFTGLQLTLNSFSQYQSGVEATITTTTGNSSTTKSSFISTTGQINLGGMADLWGLQNSDIEGQTLNVTLKFTNTTLNQTTFQYNNITLSLYYIEDQTGQSQGFTAKDIHSMNYQLYLLEAEIPEGPNREIKTITFPQSDGETIVSHSINSKDINIKFVVWGDTLTQAKQKLRAINQWLTNTRNTLNIPQPYTLIFDFESDIAYQVVLDEPITTTINYTSIECEASFTVESGVALTSENKITGPVGTNEGLTKVHPTIQVVCDGSNPVTVTEVETGQIVKINTGIPTGTVIIIDCNARTIISTEGTDYTTYADIETVWFNFFNDYNLTCSGGVIQSVEYQEGY